MPRNLQDNRMLDTENELRLLNARRFGVTTLLDREYLNPKGRLVMCQIYLNIRMATSEPRQVTGAESRTNLIQLRVEVTKARMMTL